MAYWLQRFRLAGLLFVAMQVSIFSVLAFLVVRIRGETWAPGLFLAIPLVLLMFSYLFCFCALVGLLTRYTIASLLLTILMWLFIFLTHTAETGFLLTFKVRQDQSVAIRQTDIERKETALAALKAQPVPEDGVRVGLTALGHAVASELAARVSASMAARIAAMP